MFRGSYNAGGTAFSSFPRCRLHFVLFISIKTKMGLFHENL